MDEQELIKKFNIDIEALKKEQLNLAKSLSIKDSADFSLATRFAAIENLCVKNKIISAVIVCDKDFNIIEQQYFFDKLRFPYLYGFRAYRELPSMISAFNKLNEKPDVVLIMGHGITHPRLGLASHFSLSTGIPSIGVSNSLFEENETSKNGEDILKKNKKEKVGKVLQSKENSNPIYISPGNLISIATAYDLTKKLIKHPHKLPEPLHLAHKYAKNVKEELKLN